MELTLITPGGEVSLLDGAALTQALIEHEQGRIRLREVRPGAEVDRYLATAGGEVLPLARDRIRGDALELEWAWCPDFFAGRFALVIEYDGRPLLPEVALTAVTPAHKLHADAYNRMLADLVRWAEGWTTPSPARAAASFAADGLRAQFAFLERRWAALARLVEQILERPLWALEREEREVPLHRAGLGVLGLPSDWAPVPAGAALPPAMAALAARARGHLPLSLPTERARSTFAVPANRFVAGFLAEIGRALPALAESLRARGPELPGVAAAGQALLAAIGRQIGVWRRSTWLGSVEGPLGPVEPSPRLLLHPVYGALWRLYREWQRPLALVEAGGEALPLERTYQLYEYWTFLAVARALGCELGGLVSVEGPSVRLGLSAARAFSLPVSPGVTLHFQRTFDWGGSGLQSVTHQVRPDICLVAGERVLVLDSKYRVGHDGLREGLGDLHRYRDAIVGSDGARAVVGGYVLIPAAPLQASDRRVAEAGFRERWGIGAIVATPGESLAELEAVLRGWLG
jgi:hypothetical protein